MTNKKQTPDFIVYQRREQGGKPLRHLDITDLQQQPEDVRQAWWKKLKQLNPAAAEMVKTDLEKLLEINLVITGDPWGGAILVRI